MLITVNIRPRLTEAMPTTASVLPCRQSFDEKRRSGYAPALDGRRAR
jgi:hypothetical protein